MVCLNKPIKPNIFGDHQEASSNLADAFFAIKAALFDQYDCVMCVLKHLFYPHKTDNLKSRTPL